VEPEARVEIEDIVCNLFYFFLEETLTDKRKTKKKHFCICMYMKTAALSKIEKKNNMFTQHKKKKESTQIKLYIVQKNQNKKFIYSHSCLF